MPYLEVNSNCGIRDELDWDSVIDVQLKSGYGAMWKRRRNGNEVSYRKI